MNELCGPNPFASIGGQKNLHQMGAFDRWFEGNGYQNGVFYDNEAPGCKWPWPENTCTTKTNTSTAGAGYLTSELGNRTIQWLKAIRDDSATAHRPWLIYFSTHAPHDPATAAAWYSNACVGVTSPRIPSFNYAGLHTTACTSYPPGQTNWTLDGGERKWWNGTEFPAISSCQEPFSNEEKAWIDVMARRRCQALLSVDDSYVAIIDAVEGMGELNRTYVVIR